MERQATMLDMLFGELIGRVFVHQLQIRDVRLLRYLAGMLAEFAHRDRLYRLKNAQAQPLEEVGRMLTEGDVLLDAQSFDREREVHKHVGDYTLFVTGLWPEWHESLKRNGSLDALLDYAATGKRSYWLAAQFRHEPYTDEAPVLARLADEYDLCQFGLRLVRDEMDRLGKTPPIC